VCSAWPSVGLQADCDGPEGTSAFQLCSRWDPQEKRKRRPDRREPLSPRKENYRVKKELNVRKWNRPDPKTEQDLPDLSEREWDELLGAD
jgi:hypothetical protein